MSTFPHDILVVASWFPSIVDPVAGRFVADQVGALREVGCPVRVVSFDPADLFGSGPFRRRLAEEVEWGADSARVLGSMTFSSRGSDSHAGVPVARLPIPNGRTPRDPILHAARHRTDALKRFCAQIPYRPALVHAHTGYPDGFAAAALADAFGVPLLITEHATFLDRLLSIPDARAAYVTGARRAHRVLAVSRTFADEMRASLPEIADRVDVMPNTVDVDSFVAAGPGERRPGELLFVGYWKEIKGIDVLLRALAIVRESRPEVRLRLVGEAGDPALDRRWRSLAAELGVAEAVAFEPPMDRPAVAAAMRRADVFVHASRRETFGVAAAEALAAGLPVVASDSGGVTEMLGDRATDLGAIVPRDDPEAFAAAVLDVLDRRASFDPMRLRASVVDRFGGRAVASRLLNLYEETIADWRANAGDESAHPGVATRALSAAAGEVPPGTPGPATPTIVVAFDPERARLLDKLSPTARAGVVLVTSTSSTAGEHDGFHQVVIVDLHDRVRALADARLIGRRVTGWRRILRALRHPLATARRRGLLPGLEAAITGRGTSAVRGALSAAHARGEVAPIIVCADGVDYLAVRALIESGVARMAPGGLRWLADQLSGH